MAPSADTNVIIPDWNGVMPKPIWNISGRRNGTAPTPMRNRLPPTIDALNTWLLKRSSESNGSAVLRAWSR